MEIERVCKQLPKIELHAHLNGSLSEATLKKLGCLNDNISEYQKLTKLLNTTRKTLDECFDLFRIAQNATRDKKSVYLATKSVIEEFHDDNAIYLELRTTPREETDMTRAEYIESVVQAIRDNKQDLMVKLLLSIDRRHDAKASKEAMDVIVGMKNKHPDIIKGVDLSGNPNIGDFNPDLFKQASDNGLFVTIHCAEVKNDAEVAKILEFRPDRIGHATCLHPKYGGSQEIWELYRKNPIPAECCLTSNVICGTSESYKDHHLQEWIKNSMPFAISTDDKGVFCTSLSREYLKAAESFGLTPGDLWRISHNSVDYAFATDEEKAGLRRKLEDWKSTNNLLV